MHMISPLKSLATQLVLLLLVLAATTAHSDTLVLTDGRTLEGDVHEEGSNYVLRSANGIVTRIPKHQVVSIRKSETKLSVYKKMRGQVESGADRGKPEAWYTLGQFAQEHKLTIEAQAAFTKVIELDPEHEGARKALGHVRHAGRWMTETEKMTAKGLVRHHGRWVTKEEAERRRAPGVPVRQARPLTGGPRWEKCPRCNGTGVELWIKCRQCGKSKKPGYTFHGDYFSVCPRCNGAARLPGLQCRYCRGRRMIDANNPPKKREKRVPKGFRLCPGCRGTGVDTWIRCLQCKGGPAPGVLNMGHFYLPCNRCGGTGKHVGIKCGTCRGCGLVSEK